MDGNGASQPGSTLTISGAASGPADTHDAATIAAPHARRVRIIVKIDENLGEPIYLDLLVGADHGGDDSGKSTSGSCVGLFDESSLAAIEIGSPSCKCRLP